jgi:hypothetical protein
LYGKDIDRPFFMGELQMRKRILLTLSGIVLGGFAANSAWATVSFSYVTDSASYSAAQGATVAVSIYLKETLTNSSTDIIGPDGGLDSAGAAVNVASSTGTAASIGSSSFTAASPFGQPGAGSIYYNQSPGNNLEFSELTGPSGPFPTPTGGLILLGTLDITTGLGTTTYHLTSLNDDTIPDAQLGDGGGDGFTEAKNTTDFDVADGSGYTGADAASQTIFTVTGTAVPEPASFTLLGLGGFALLGRFRRRV